jgi:purine-binding chemotaxis protein CheW
MSQLREVASQSPDIELEVLLFELAGERFGVASRDVLEVLRAVAIRPLPLAPKLVEGIIDLRGELVPVLDIRARLGLPAKSIEPSDHFVLSRVAQRRVVLRVDRALSLAEVRRLPLTAAENLPGGIAHISGAARLSDGLILIHDLAEFLSGLEVSQLDQALAGEAGGSSA